MKGACAAAWPCGVTGFVFELVLLGCANPPLQAAVWAPKTAAQSAQSAVQGVGRPRAAGRFLFEFGRLVCRQRAGRGVGVFRVPVERPHEQSHAPGGPWRRRLCDVCGVDAAGVCVFRCVFCLLPRPPHSPRHHPPLSHFFRAGHPPQRRHKLGRRAVLGRAGVQTRAHDVRAHCAMWHYGVGVPDPGNRRPGPLSVSPGRAGRRAVLCKA